MQMQFLGKKRVTGSVWQYDFTPERPLDYIPGQYVAVHLPQVENDARGKSRTFSLTSLPSERLLSFVSYYPEPATPYKQILQSLRPGDMGTVDDAMGDVILPKLPTVPLLFIAGGIGMASYVSMLRELQRTNETRHIDLLYALRHPEDDAFADLVDSFPFASKQRFVRPERLHLRNVRPLVAPDTLIYLSGSQDFVESLRAGLRENGTPNSRVIFDFFDGYADL